MVSIQKNSPISFGVMYSSLNTTGKTANERNISNFIAENKIVLFSSQIKTDTRQNLSDQNAISHFNQLSKEGKASLTYNGTPISELSVEQANDLIGSDGHFGIDKTSQRIIDFVIKGAGNNIDRLRAGREGVLRGFAEAEKAWGGKLPDISYETLAKSLDSIDEKLREQGESVVDFIA